MSLRGGRNGSLTPMAFDPQRGATRSGMILPPAEAIGDMPVFDGNRWARLIAGGLGLPLVGQGAGVLPIYQNLKYYVNISNAIELARIVLKSLMHKRLKWH